MEVETLKYPAVRNYIAGKFVDDASAAGVGTMDVFSPLTGEVISTVPLSGMDALNQAVEAAKAAYPKWSSMPIKERVQVFFRYKTLLEKNMDELTRLVHIENGKTYDEARAEVEKAIELTEFATSMPQLIAGEILEVSRAQAAGRGGQHCPLQLPEHGSSLDDAERHRAGQLHDHEALRAGSAQLHAYCRPAEGSRSAGWCLQRSERRSGHCGSNL
jgi:hypothetical protein